jgi:predicted restriction endonuclease
MSINKLEKFLDKVDNTEILKLELYDYTKFGYTEETELEFMNHVSFLLDTCYNIRLRDNAKIRIGQKKFREEMFKKFNSKCIISGNDCEDELKACHIIPVADNESYDIDNGLLLTSTFHDTMDKYLWSINPETLKVQIHPTKNVGQIKKYNGKKINIKLNKDLESNLKIHWTNFINNQNL